MNKRQLKLSFLQAARGAGLFRIARQATAKAARVLCYHGVWLGGREFGGDAMFIRAETFASRMASLKRLGHPVVTLDHAVEALAGRRVLPPAAVAITIDDGWYSTYAHMLPALQAQGFPATLYCDTASLERGKPIPHVMARYLHQVLGKPPLTGPSEVHFNAATNVAAPYDERWSALFAFAEAMKFDLRPWITDRAFDYMTAEELRDFAAKPGIDIQLHTHNHTLGDMSASKIGHEIAANAAALARLLHAKPSQFRHFCYPSGETTREAARVLSDLGLASSTTTASGLCHVGGDPQLLPRFLDGDNVSDVEFEAEISGFLPLLRSGIDRTKRSRPWVGSSSEAAA